MRGGIIAITKDNVDALQASLDSLIDNRETMLLYIKKYPLEISFDTYRFVCENREQLEELTNTLKTKIGVFRAGALTP